MTPFGLLVHLLFTIPKVVRLAYTGNPSPEAALGSSSGSLVDQTPKSSTVKMVLLDTQCKVFSINQPGI